MSEPSNQSPYVPVWHSLSGHAVGNFWEVYSLKAGRVVRLHSDLAYYFWVLLESDPAVTAICEQPLRIRARVDGEWVTSVFDMWYREKDGSEVFCGIRYTKAIRTAAIKNRGGQQLSAQLAWAIQRGVRYCIATDKTIWARPQLLSNWIYILGFINQSRQGLESDMGERIVRAVAATREATVATIEAIFASEARELVRAALFKVLHDGQLTADLSRCRLASDTVFRLPT